MGRLLGGSRERRDKTDHRPERGRWFCQPAVRQASPIQSAALAPTQRLQNGRQDPQRTEVRSGWGAATAS